VPLSIDRHALEPVGPSQIRAIVRFRHIDSVRTFDDSRHIAETNSLACKPKGKAGAEAGRPAIN
jgi:hypothetical protein